MIVLFLFLLVVFFLGYFCELTARRIEVVVVLNLQFLSFLLSLSRKSNKMYDDDVEGEHPIEESESENEKGFYQKK
jgi:hypothetical protein